MRRFGGQESSFDGLSSHGQLVISGADNSVAYTWSNWNDVLVARLLGGLRRIVHHPWDFLQDLGLSVHNDFWCSTAAVATVRQVPGGGFERAFHGWVGLDGHHKAPQLNARRTEAKVREHAGSQSMEGTPRPWHFTPANHRDFAIIS